MGQTPLMDGGSRTVRPVYVGDVARGINAVLNAGITSRVVELAGDELSIRSAVELFCEYARRPFHPLSVSHSLIRFDSGKTHR